MDTRVMKYFISVAEHLNFTRAAEENHIAQQALSQQIITLERQLDVQLLVRDNRSVKLTPAGYAFLEGSRKVIAETNATLLKTKQVAIGKEGSLSIGYWGPYERIFATNFVKSFHKAYPNISVSIKHDSSRNIIEHLHNQSLDISFVFPIVSPDEKRIVYKNIGASPLSLVVSKRNPLAKMKMISSPVLSKQDFIIIDLNDYPGLNERLLQQCNAMGFIPNIILRPHDIESELVMVEADMGITLLHDELKSVVSPNLVFIEIEGNKQYMETGIAWLKKNNNPALSLCLQMILDDKQTRYIKDSAKVCRMA